MTSKLAKRLKEAGFPQGYFWVKFPTIEELFEELGEEVRLQSYWDKNDLMWQADNSSNFLVKPPEKQIEGIGYSPLEALSELYIAKHKK